MKNTLTIARREFRSYFNGPAAYIVGCLFLIVVAIMFWNSFFLEKRASVRRLFFWAYFVGVFVAPALTMGLLAEALGTVLPGTAGTPAPDSRLLARSHETGRLIVAHEAPTFGGIGGEIAARVTERAFLSLEAPVIRVGGFHMPYPVAKVEEHYLPDIDKLMDALDRSFAY